MKTEHLLFPQMRKQRIIKICTLNNGVRVNSVITHCYDERMNNYNYFRAIQKTYS
jgi:hypothetical protein